MYPDGSSMGACCAASCTCLPLSIVVLILCSPTQKWLQKSLWLHAAWCWNGAPLHAQQSSASAILALSAQLLW